MKIIKIITGRVRDWINGTLRQNFLHFLKQIYDEDEDMSLG